ncbi:protein FAM43B-like [Xenopus tropicalis]|uniref:Protein FAM43B-like n=1 Tax=Xenopus tropicalis TaxID=8364 RepID=A0A8J1JZM6_XENTR|nr:protein FAM43B-like [Xenopus tropicalis]
MLPWRRKGKFVLAQKEQNGKALSYPSLLPSFLRSCPDLLPNISGQCLGTMFGRKRRTVELTREEPSDKGRYLGSAVTLRARGRGLHRGAVGQIGGGVRGGSRAPRVRLLVSSEGISGLPWKGKPATPTLLHRIPTAAQDTPTPGSSAGLQDRSPTTKADLCSGATRCCCPGKRKRRPACDLPDLTGPPFCDFKRLKRQNDFRRGHRRGWQCVVPWWPLRRRYSMPGAIIIPEEVRAAWGTGA